jgi:hypothetical protein
MVAKVALLWGLKVSLITAGVFYFVQLLATYTESQQYQRPVRDRRNFVESSGRLLAWAGNAAFAVSVRLGRPVFEMLCEASADLGEWVLSRPAGRSWFKPRTQCNSENDANGILGRPLRWGWRRAMRFAFPLESTRKSFAIRAIL